VQQSEVNQFVALWELKQVVEDRLWVREGELRDREVAPQPTEEVTTLLFVVIGATVAGEDRSYTEVPRLKRCSQLGCLFT